MLVFYSLFGLLDYLRDWGASLTYRFYINDIFYLSDNTLIFINFKNEGKNYEKKSDYSIKSSCEITRE